MWSATSAIVSFHGNEVALYARVGRRHDRRRSCNLTKINISTPATPCRERCAQMGA